MSDSQENPVYHASIEPTGIDVPVHVPAGFYDPAAVLPHFYSGGGWQRSDSDHPAGAGMPGYRVAYKTIKAFVVPDFVATFPNMRLHVGQGNVERGGMRAREDAFPGRRWNQRIIPEYGRAEVDDQGSSNYVGDPDLRFEFSGWEETLERLGFVEIIVKLDVASDSSATELYNLGRRAVASLRAQLDFVFGPRILGACVLEEVGAVFEDWHWNRRLDTVQLAAEGQVGAEIIPASWFAKDFNVTTNRLFAKPRAEQRRIALASRWYWLAEAEEDPVNRFLQYWIVIESLEMKDSNIKPVAKRISQLFTTPDVSVWANRIGRLFGQRGKLVHGEEMNVDEVQLEMVELTARALLAFRLTNSVPIDAGRRLQSLVGP